MSIEILASKFQKEFVFGFVFIGALLSNPTQINYDNPLETLQYKIKKNEALKTFGENPHVLGTDMFSFYRLIFSNINDDKNPIGIAQLNRKTIEESREGIKLRKNLEDLYDNYFYFSGLPFTSNHEWAVPAKGNFSEKSFSKAHEAIDIFAKDDSGVFSPLNGVVAASGDSWKGECCIKKNIYDWNGKGLTPRAGNGIVIYNPSERGYFWISHLQEGINVRAGQFVYRGQQIGKVGSSGNASGKIPHVHIAYKISDGNGALRGINFYERIKTR